MANRISASVRKGPAPCLSVFPAGTPRRCPRYPVEALTWMVPVCRQHGRRRCYPTVPVAAHQCTCYRVIYRNCIRSLHPRRHILQYKPCRRVSLLCSAFLRGYEHAVKSEVAVLQMLSRQTHNVTYLLTTSVIHIIANCYYRPLGQYCYEIRRPAEDYNAAFQTV